mmetsp:Transcript_36605/g.44711  ORF Transcript_36605/g.44711 Transcript_36605/m.44711 type:complete len:375 (-) Transcript_36605:1047-2171(-)
MDLLVHDLVDLLHVVEHLVSLLVQRVQLLLVLFKLDLSVVHLLTRVILLNLRLDTLEDLLLVVSVPGGVEVGVLVLAVVHGDGLLTLDLDWAAELLDVAREGLGEHLRVQARELGEDVFEHEVLRDGERLHVFNRNVLVLTALRGEDIVVADVAVALVVLGYLNLLLPDVLLPRQVLLTLIKLSKALYIIFVRVVTDGPLAVHNEVNLSDVALLVEDVAVFRDGVEAARHEAKGHLVDEVGVEFAAHAEEVAEAGPIDDVVEQEVRHDELLDPVRDRIEVLALLEQDFAAVVVPVVSEVVLDFFFQVRVDVKAAAMGLVLDAADQIEPLLQFLLVQTLILAFDRDHNVLELVHQDREEGDAKDLNDAAEDLLHN